jgi:PKD repeat protein
VPTPINVTEQNLDTTCLATFRGFSLIPPTDPNECPVTPPTPPTAPVAVFTFQPLASPPSPAHTEQFFGSNSTGTPPLRYTWNFGDGTTINNDPNAANPTHTYTAAGNYTVRLTVSNAAGSSPENAQVVPVP